MFDIKKIYETYPLLTQAIPEITKAGGTAYLVGGAVRDIILHRELHDLDIEVHGLSMEQVTEILSDFGVVNLVGKSFGVLKIYGNPLDWSLPRTDTSGRKPEVSIDPHMGIKQALARRDLTMNAMAIDLHSGVLIDPFNGQEDIKNCILRSPDISFFCEDPLRFYRVMQFVGRFEMEPDELLIDVCKTMDISHVSKERIEDEFEKLLLKSKQPSRGLRWIEKIGRLHEILPELADTLYTEQNPQWHPEGNVFEHLMQTIDAAATIGAMPVLGDEQKLEKRSVLHSHCGQSQDEILILLCAALCHDLGKVFTTILKDGVLKSPGHAEAGVPLARSLLKRITLKVRIIDTVCLLVRWHMEPAQFVKQNASLAAYRRLAVKLSKYTTIEKLSQLALADQRGRNPKRGEPLTTTPEWFFEFIRKAKEAAVFHKPELPVLSGKDIGDLVAPGKKMGQLLHYAYELQLDQGIKDKAELRAAVIKYMKQ